MKETTRFRQLIEAEEILVQPGVYDGFSARLVQQMGFEAGSISGAGLPESNLGWADVGLMGYEENLHASRAIAACVDIPLSADGDTGYGNAINVFFTVRGFEAAGVDGLMLDGFRSRRPPPISPTSPRKRYSSAKAR
jgi:2-methylisocitrate lyase-like PEP mutase family enzyme